MKYPSNTHNRLHKLFKNDIIVRNAINPKTKKHAVEVIDKRNIVYKKNRTVGEYKHSTKTINLAIEETIMYIYKKLINQ